MSLNLKYYFTICLFLVAICCVSMTLPVQSESALLNAATPSADAGKLFEKHCAGCHGSDGRAKTFKGKLTGAQDLADAKWQSGETDRKIAEAIRTGPGAMPSFEKKLTNDEIDSMVILIRQFK
jgi:mono/diheme cytochrome c family protein